MWATGDGQCAGRFHDLDHFIDQPGLEGFGRCKPMVFTVKPAFYDGSRFAGARISRSHARGHLVKHFCTLAQG